MKTETTAVLDIGKTNKKAIIFDMDLNALSITTKQFPEIDNHGFLVEQPEAIFQWFLETLSEKSDIYDIKAISITTHGASIVCIDQKGELTTPTLCYTNKADQHFAQRFYDKYGSRELLHRHTVTPEVGHLVNSAKLIYFMQEQFPKQFAKTQQILFYPQYFVYKLTGSLCVEPTMLGCHTYLYDPKIKHYSSVAKQLGVSDLMPRTIRKSWESAGKIRNEIARKYNLSSDCIVTMGIHDSNSSLLPYRLSLKKDFVLNSTGTWCVTMRPCNSVEIKDDQLNKMVFYNFDVFEQPVKTSMFMGGKEYEKYMEILNNIHHQNDQPEFDANIYDNIFNNADTFILPTITKGTGLFPNHPAAVIEGERYIRYQDIINKKAVPEFFYDYQHATAVLNISLAIQTSIAIKHIGYTDSDTVYVEGGFTKNIPYLKILACLLPKSKIMTSSMPQATATGAAILGLSALANTAPDELTIKPLIQSRHIQNNINLNTDKYVANFIDSLNNTCMPLNQNLAYIDPSNKLQGIQ
ncbi:MAG: carbohydrate kinase [Phycisphaerae bacterium]|nr:carbohydrate kinase [Phycisphaerae bacterium]